MLKLRSAIVLEVEASAGPAGDPAAELREQRLVVQLAGSHERREAVADVTLLGRAEVGDEVIVNAEALDLDLAAGTAGPGVVHVNLTRGLGLTPPSEAGVMKLSHTSLQHAVQAVDERSIDVPVARPVAVLALHGQLAAVAWAFAQAAPQRRLGYVHTDGGTLPGGHSQTVAALRARGLLAGHITAGAAYGGEAEAITVAGALQHGLRTLRWDAAVCGPGPGIVGSESALGHGGMAALDSAHVALALGCPTLLVARMSSGSERSPHRGISHHTLTVLDLLLEPVTVALPAGMRSPVGMDLRAGLGAVFSGSEHERPAAGLDVERPVRITRHDWRRASVDLPAYAASGLPRETLGRGPAEDPLFCGAALAGGAALAELVGEARPVAAGGGEGEGEAA